MDKVLYCVVFLCPFSCVFDCMLSLLVVFLSHLCLDHGIWCSFRVDRRHLLCRLRGANWTRIITWTDAGDVFSEPVRLWLWVCRVLYG